VTQDSTSASILSIVRPGQRVAMLAPHPDDFDSIGVTMRACREQGCPISVTVLTGSASGVLDSFRGPDQAVKASAREEEQRASIRWFGLTDDSLGFLRLPEDAGGHLVADSAAEQAICDVLVSIGPDVVFLPHGNDTNLSHQRVCAIFRDIACTWSRTLVACYIRDPKTRGMRVDAVMPFSHDLAQWKGQLLRHHESQQQRNLTVRGYGFDQRILDVNRSIAWELHLTAPFAEAFEVEVFEPTPV